MVLEIIIPIQFDNDLWKADVKRVFFVMSNDLS